MTEQKQTLNPIEIDITRLPSKGHLVKFKATDRERHQVSDAFGLVALDSLEAELRLTRWRREGVAVKGWLRASLVQSCVVSLKPVHQQIDEEVSMLFVPDGSPLARPDIDAHGEMLIDPEGAEIPDTFTGSHIMVSEVILESLNLAIDPHPRLPGVHISAEYNRSDEEEEKPPSPFEVLSALKK